MLVVGRKFNFSVATVPGERNFIHPKLRSSYFRVYYNIMLVNNDTIRSFLYPVDAFHSWLPHCDQKYLFKMATVSYQKATLEGLKGLVMPLDR